MVLNLSLTHSLAYSHRQVEDEEEYVYYTLLLRGLAQTRGDISIY